MTRLLRLAALAALFPAAALAQAPTDLAIAHARATAGFAGAEFVATDAVRSARSGVDHVYLRQTVGGLEVVGTEASVAVSKGAVSHAAGLDRVVNAAGLSVPTASVSAAAAANVVARHNGLGAGMFSVVGREGGVSRAVTLSEGGVAAEPVDVRLVLRATEGGLRLAWEVELYQADAQHAWLAYVDARTRELIDQTDLVVHDTFEAPAPSFAPVRQVAPISPYVAAREASMAGSYTVYAMPVEAPIYASPAPPSDARTSEASPDDATASPFGWHDTNGAAGPEYTITRGNNVHAYTDVDANNSPDAGSSPDGGSGLTFDFPLDLSQAPSAYRPAAVTNLFYWNNVTHDVLYHHGFDEAAGNFQVNNYGNGGAGNDDVRAEAQDGGGTNNANFYTPSDGARPRMQMYIGTYSAPDVDGSFDNGVVVHEYGHGISNRLTGGPAQSGCLGNAEQMGEGWSDWYAMMLTMEAGDVRTDSRGMGNYLFDYGVNGGGIRLAPYDTDFADNDYTYGRTASMSAVHQIGFVWATILWEVTWDMIDAHGFSPDLYDGNGTAGNQIMLRLVTEGMKYQPCQPGFVTGRDGILAAEQAIYGGAYEATLQEAFARRGLGFSADQGSSTRTSDNVEAFDLWGAPPPPPPPSAITLSVTQTGGRKPKVQLSWSGASGSRVDILRNGGQLSRTRNDGSFTDRNGSSGDAYQVCETSNGGACSSVVSALTANATAGGIDTDVRVAPNPTADAAQLSFGLNEAGDVELAVFNAIGQRVAVLAAGAHEAGRHTVRFDAGALPSGVYVYRLVGGGDVQTGQIVVAR